MKKINLFLALAASLAITTAPVVFARGGGHSGGHYGSSSSGHHSSSYHSRSYSRGGSAVSYPGPSASDVHVNGYTRSDGTYVQSHVRTQADLTKLNNFSTEGNVNPYTGQPGTKSPY